MVKLIGAACMLLGCGGFGFAMAAASRREEEDLRSLVRILGTMSCELNYRQTPLPELCRGAVQGETGRAAAFFLELARALEKGDAPDVPVCVRAVLDHLEPDKRLGRELREMGSVLGRFDLPGQLRGLDAAIRSAETALREMRDGAGERRRSYQTLGLCCGAAMAILFL